jgi:hypothetical protein
MATSKSRAPAARKTTSRAAGKAAAGDVEVVEEAGGMDLDTGVGIVTALLLITALVLIDYELGKAFGAGMLFK